MGYEIIQTSTIDNVGLEFAKIILYFVTLFLCARCIFYHDKNSLIGCCFFFILLFWVKDELTRERIGEFGWRLSMILVCFLAPKEDLFSPKNFKKIDLFQKILLSHYFLAGAWKLITFIKSESPINYLKFAGTEAVAETIAEGFGPPPILFELIRQFPYIVTLGFIGVIIFQLSTALPIFFRLPILYWGFGAVIFHMITGLFIGFWFYKTTIIVLLFIVYPNILKRNEPYVGSALRE